VTAQWGGLNLSVDLVPFFSLRQNKQLRTICLLGQGLVCSKNWKSI